MVVCVYLLFNLMMIGKVDWRNWWILVKGLKIYLIKWLFLNKLIFVILLICWVFFENEILVKNVFE